MSKTKAELVAENLALKKDVAVFTKALGDSNNEVRLNVEYVTDLEVALSNRQEWLVKAREEGERYQKDYKATYARNLQLAKDYGELAKENLRLSVTVDRQERTIAAFNKLILAKDDHDSELYT